MTIAQELAQLREERDRKRVREKAQWATAFDILKDWSFGVLGVSLFPMLGAATLLEGLKALQPGSYLMSLVVIIYHGVLWRNPELLNG